MNNNIGQIDKVVRIVIGTGVIISGIALKNIIGLIGILPLATAIIGHSPFYALLKITTSHQEY